MGMQQHSNTSFLYSTAVPWACQQHSSTSFFYSTAIPWACQQHSNTSFLYSTAVPWAYQQHSNTSFLYSTAIPWACQVYHHLQLYQTVIVSLRLVMYPLMNPLLCNDVKKIANDFWDYFGYACPIYMSYSLYQGIPILFIGTNYNTQDKKSCEGKCIEC